MAKVPRSYDKEWQDILHGSVIHGGGYEIRVLIRGELPFLVVLVMLCGFEFGGDAWLSRLDNPLVAALLFAYLFIAMMWGAFGAVRRADALAEMLGEPYGTPMLTMAVIGIEVAQISAFSLSGEAAPTLARGTMHAVISA